MSAGLNAEPFGRQHLSDRRDRADQGQLNDAAADASRSSMLPSAERNGTVVSYAQAKEDVLLWRALASRVHHDVGFWIDVGAYDPIIDSVTKVYSEHGWRGINIEPVEASFRRLEADRPHDINIQAVVSDKSGTATFHEIVGHQLGTLVEKYGDRHAAAGFERRKIEVPALTLTEICEEHAPDQIHFLKIDVEGHEGAVLRGMDFSRYRPWVLVIEAAEPNNINAPAFEDWDGLVIASGYRFVFTDKLNRYYVAEEHPELFGSFALPLGDYVRAGDLRPADRETRGPDRRVGFESRKTYADKIESGFVARYLSGPAVLEVGYKGYYDETVPIVPQAIGVDLGYPGYDGINLPFADGSFDAIYSSHCLEHIDDYVAAIRDWYRVLRVGGHIVVAVPHQHLFEKKRDLPSLGNSDHKRFYTARSLLAEFEAALEENSYRVRHLQENDAGFDYGTPANSSPNAQFEIEAVIEKIAKPNWNLSDGTVRPYAAAEFMTSGRRVGPWRIDVDLSDQAGGHAIYGPYATLRPARYVAEFYVEIEGGASLAFDVAINNQTVGMWQGQAIPAGSAIAIPFTVDPGLMGVVEFRAMNVAPASGATLSFKGVNLAYATD